MIQKIGSMVYQLRKKVYVSQENLSRGLLSVAELSRIENGEKEGDSFLMSALFQRLGKSMDQFEMAVTNDEYKLVLLRAFIQESMGSGDYDRTEELLDEYEVAVEGDKLLQAQYTRMMRAVLQYLMDRNPATCLEKLKGALEITFVDEGHLNWTGYCFCIQEIQLLLLIAYLEMEKGEAREAVLLLAKLHDCIDASYTSEVSKVQVYPKCCYLLAKAYLAIGEKKEAFAIAEKGMRNLINTGSLIFINELLELQQMCEWSEEREKQIKAIQFAYDLAKCSLPEEFIVQLLFGGICDELILSNELLREVRIAQGRSQEEVSDGICSRETLARIEKGRTPSKSNLQDLIKKLGIEREKYYSYVFTDDWDVYELLRDYKKNCFMENQENALEILEDIRNKLDLSVPANRQFVEAAYLRYQIRKRELKGEEAVEKLTEVLRYTMPEYEGKLYRVPYREEFIILNRIALCLKLSGKMEEALALYEELLQKYQSSKIKPEHHTNVMMLLYLNYLGLLERCDYLKKAENLGKTGLELMLKYQRGDVVGMFLANLACVYEKSSTQAEKSLALPCLEASYSLLRLYKLEKKSVTVKKYIDEHYLLDGAL